MTKNAIGIVELSSIAAGYATSDAMLKAANVNMLLTRSICSGKFMVMVGGDVAGVQAAVDAGVAISEGTVIDSAVLSNIDKSVFPAISGATTVGELEALGIIESC
jgi:microcompartment protein CcmL/EutN